MASIEIDRTEAMLMRWAITRFLGLEDCPIGRQHPWWNKLDGVADKLLEEFPREV